MSQPYRGIPSKTSHGRHGHSHTSHRRARSRSPHRDVVRTQPPPPQQQHLCESFMIKNAATRKTLCDAIDNQRKIRFNLSKDSKMRTSIVEVSPMFEHGVVVLLHNIASFACTDETVTIYKDASLRVQGAMVFNTIAASKRMPFGVFPLANKEGDGPLDMGDRNSFYLATDAQEILCRIRDGVTIVYNKNRGLYFVSSEDGDSSMIVVDEKGKIVGKNDSEACMQPLL